MCLLGHFLVSPSWAGRIVRSRRNPPAREGIEQMEDDMVSQLRRILVAAAILGAGLGAPAALEVVAASPAGAATALTFQMSPCPGSGATGKGSVSISQTGKSLTIVERVSNDLPNAGQFIAVADAIQPPFVFGSFPLNSRGSALFEVHQTTTIPTGVSAGDSIVFLAIEGENFVFPPLMASDSANCGL